MYLALVDVEPQKDYKLLLTFENKEVREFDVSKYFGLGRFVELKDQRLFQSVRINLDTIEWSNKLDLDPEFLYENSISLPVTKTRGPSE
jgi:hypothetical protein